MNIRNVCDAGEKLCRLLDETAGDHEPSALTGSLSNAVLMGEEDWNGTQETLYLLSVPDMRDSIREGMNTAVEECNKEPGW